MTATQRLAGQAQQGQSLTELALVMPLPMVVLLIGINFGLALHAQTGLTQVTQQTAQRLVHHPEDATKDWVAGTINAMGAETVSANEITIRFQAAGQDPSTGQPTAQQIVISLSHPYPVVVPIADSLNWGPLHAGSLRLSTTASTVLATPPPANLAVAAGAGSGCAQGTWHAGSTFTVSWGRPVEPDGSAMPATVPLIYKLYAAMPGFSPNLIYTSPPSTSSTLCYVDQDSITGTQYQMWALEPDGLSSAGSATVTAP